MIRFRNSCYDSILLCLPEICDGGLGLEVTQLVTSWSPGGTHVVLTIKPRTGAMSALCGFA